MLTVRKASIIPIIFLHLGAACSLLGIHGSVIKHILCVYDTLKTIINILIKKHRTKGN